MLSLKFFFLIFWGICLLVIGIAFKVLKLPKGNSRKNTGNSIFDKLVSNRIFGQLLGFITRDKSSLPNKYALRLIEHSESALDLQKFYIIKFACTLICAVLIIVIGITNAAFEIKLIVSSTENFEYLNSRQDLFDSSNYKLFKQIRKDIGLRRLLNSSDEENRVLLETRITQFLNTSDNRLISENTDWFIQKLQKIKDIQVFKTFHIWMLLGSFFLPELFLLLRWLLRGCVYRKEIIKLEYIFELLARIDGIKTIDIIEQMEKSSKIYSVPLCEFIRIFKYDKRKGFNYLRNKNIKSLSKLAEILEIYSLSDKEIALQILEREVIERDEAIIITADETLDFIDLAAFLSIVPLVYELVMLMLRPMLDVVYKAFEFI